uniref:LisH domain-containing protein n=1 Tax=Elaeophora elaphi TaxID=1147741 RepID=A0A0R3RZB3_9BILA
MESNSTNSDVRKMIDTLVAGYLGRQKYWESLKCLINESSILHAAQCGGMSIVLGDTVHGKHLEEIVILFSEYGNFGLNPGLLDFGVRLRSLANEFTSLTNAGAHWSDAQKLLYGKYSTPSRNCSQQCLSVMTEELNVCETNQSMLPAANADSTTSISSYSNGSTSTRRKCSQPVSINTRRREFMKEVVEPVVHTAQQIIDNGNSNITDPNSSLSALSVITIDENAVGTLDRCMAHENFAELIESIEKDFPDGFFDSFPNSDNTESLHEAVFDAVSSQTNEVQQEQPRGNDSQNLFNIPHSAAIEESKPLCSSTPTKLKTQEKSPSVPETLSSESSSTSKNESRRLQPKPVRKKPIVAESAIFKDRVEVECPYLPVEETEKEEIDDRGQDFFLSSKNFTKSQDSSFGKAKADKLEISAGWRKLAELCDESNRKVIESEGQKTAMKSNSLEICQPTNQKSKDKGAKDLSSSSTDLEMKKKIRNEPCIPLSANNNTDVTGHQSEKCMDDKGTVQNTKFTSKSLIEREIDLLFENSDDQDCGNSHTQKADEWKSSDSTHAASTRENRKGSEDKDEISGDEGAIVGNCQRQVPAKLAVDKKKRKYQKQKSVGGDFASDSKIFAAKKKQLEEMYVNSPILDSEQQGDSSLAGSSPLCKTSEQYKKEKFKKLEEGRDEARMSAERRKKEREFLMKKEREEIERQKREVEEKEIKRAAERERKRREEEEREAREKEQREKRRKEREDREKLKKMKEKDDKLSSPYDLRKPRERSRDGKSKKELRGTLQSDSKSDEANEASILDKLFGGGDSLKPATKNSDKEEAKRKFEENRVRPSYIQKTVGKVKVIKEECRAKKGKSERVMDIKATKTSKESGSNRPDALDDLFNCLAAKPDTSRKDEADVMESKSYKKVVSGVNKGRENLLVGGGHSARVGMVLEKATRIRTKYEHEEKLKQEYRKVEGIRRATASSSEHNNRKRILDLPIPKTPNLLSQLLKSDISIQNNSLRRSMSAKNINNCSTTNTIATTSLKIPISSSSTTTISCSGSSESKSLHHNEASGNGSPTVQVKKPRLDMAAIDAVLQSLHGLDKASSSSQSFSTASLSGSESTLTLK